MNQNLAKAKTFGLAGLQIALSGFLLLFIGEKNDISGLVLAANIVFIVMGLVCCFWAKYIINHFWENQRYSKAFKYIFSIFAIISFGVGLVACAIFLIWYTFNEIKREKNLRINQFEY